VNLRIQVLDFFPTRSFIVSERLLTAYKKRVKPPSVDKIISLKPMILGEVKVEWYKVC
jgi:hypothetical protein